MVYGSLRDQAPKIVFRKIDLFRPPAPLPSFKNHLNLKLNMFEPAAHPILSHPSLSKYFLRCPVNPNITYWSKTGNMDYTRLSKLVASDECPRILIFDTRKDIGGKTYKKIQHVRIHLIPITSTTPTFTGKFFNVNANCHSF